MHRLGAVISSVHATRLSSFSEGAQSAWMARHSFSPWLASHFHSYINQESWINNESLSPMSRMKRLLDSPSHLIESWPREKIVSAYGRISAGLCESAMPLSDHDFGIFGSFGRRHFIFPPESLSHLTERHLSTKERSEIEPTNLLNLLWLLQECSSIEEEVQNRIKRGIKRGIESMHSQNLPLLLSLALDLCSEDQALINDLVKQISRAADAGGLERTATTLVDLIKVFSSKRWLIFSGNNTQMLLKLTYLVTNQKERFCPIDLQGVIQNIRPHLSKEQLHLMDQLVRFTRGDNEGQGQGAPRTPSQNVEDLGSLLNRRVDLEARIRLYEQRKKE